jgi:imidazoleglycerol phosphate synthase glutamine amidotransferase subunit HisH
VRNVFLPWFNMQRLQLLLQKSEEFGAGKGLDLISELRFLKSWKKNIKVPHIAWNTIYKLQQDWDHSAF